MCADKTDWHVQCSSSLQGLEIGSLLLLHAVPFLLERHLSTIPPARKHKVMITLVKSTVYIKMFCVILDCTCTNRILTAMCRVRTDEVSINANINPIHNLWQ